jgi:hypothetical protein
MQETFLANNWIVLGIVLIAVWSLIWKGLALWKAARLNDKAWFIAIMILNTVGLLEIFYIFVFSKRTPKVESSTEPKQETTLN